MPSPRPVLFFIALCLIGCAVRDDVKDARKSAQELRDSALRLESLSGKMSDYAENLYEDAREGGTVEILRETFNQMLRGGRESVVRKLEYASIYFATHEFQFWRARRVDTEEYREILLARAVDLFFAEIDDLIDESYPVTVTNIYSQGFQNWLNLSVLSLAMDRIHDRQILLAKRLGFRPLSMLDLIKDGLDSRAARESGSTIPLWATRVLQREQQAIYLLQLRQNFLPMVVLGLMSDFDEGLWEMGRRMLFYWNLDLSFANLEQVTMWSDLLAKAAATRQWLKSRGHAVITNFWVARAYGNLRVLKLPPSLSAETAPHWREFLSLLNTVSGVSSSLRSE